MNILIAILATLAIWGVMNRFIEDDDDEDFELILSGIQSVICDTIITIKKKLTWKRSLKN